MDKIQTIFVLCVENNLRRPFGNIYEKETNAIYNYPNNVDILHRYIRNFFNRHYSKS